MEAEKKAVIIVLERDYITTEFYSVLIFYMEFLKGKDVCANIEYNISTKVGDVYEYYR